MSNISKYFEYFQIFKTYKKVQNYWFHCTVICANQNYWLQIIIVNMFMYLNCNLYTAVAILRTLTNSADFHALCGIFQTIAVYKSV